MWEKIKANSAYVYLGIIVIGYLSYAIYTYGFDELILGYFGAEDDYWPEGQTWNHLYFDFLLVPLLGSFMLIAHLYLIESKYAKLAGQLFAVLLVVFLIYLRKNL